MYEYSDYDGWENWNRWLSKYEEYEHDRPTCAWCGEQIMDEIAYEFPNGDIVCEDCVGEYIDETFRKHIG